MVLTGRVERKEELRLLAAIAQGLGFEDLADYEPPTVTDLIGQADGGTHDPEVRRLIVAEHGDVEEVQGRGRREDRLG